MQILLNKIKSNDGGINFRDRIVAQRLGEMRLSPPLPQGAVSRSERK
jgi:hypothetical protein